MSFELGTSSPLLPCPPAPLLFFSHWSESRDTLHIIVVRSTAKVVTIDVAGKFCHENQ
ncbi:hypothetical protein [[Phormidium ambiguum] IAM M-71]|uniref:hypothetical protein n=1 Tax=[Phormidium ambiguum] IAM M-71 TaxID=454136 RepID=UPI0015C12940|nr:hypothetical protein [Phormidium ambiguum]